jgi:hypothetical protein
MPVGSARWHPQRAMEPHSGSCVVRACLVHWRARKRWRAGEDSSRTATRRDGCRGSSAVSGRTASIAPKRARWCRRGRRCGAVWRAGVATHHASRSGRGGGHEADHPCTHQPCGHWHLSVRRDPGTELGTPSAHHRDGPGGGPMAGRMQRSLIHLQLTRGSRPRSPGTPVVGIADRTTTHRHPTATAERGGHRSDISAMAAWCGSD